MLYNESDLLITYDYLLKKWGIIKVTRLSRIENPLDTEGIKDRISLAILDSQNEILGFLGYLDWGEAYPSIKQYAIGILHLFVEYRLNPADFLLSQISLAKDMMIKMKSDQLDLQRSNSGSLGIFVV